MTFALLAVLLTGPLETWRVEIEKTGQQAVTVLRLAPGELAPAGVADKAALDERFFDNPNFQQQLMNAQALSISYPGRDKRISIVVLNPRQTPAEDEPYVIAHELGHLWLKAQNYPAPVYTGGSAACLAILAGDAVQHVLIREEMDRRGLAWREPWIRSLRKALGALEEMQEARTPNRCQAVTQAVLWIDVELGLRDAEWDGRRRMLELLPQRFPAVQPTAGRLAEALRREKLSGRTEHKAALQAVFQELKTMALSLPN